MPRKSDRQKVLEGMETALVGSLWKMKMAEQKSKAVQTNPTHQLTFDFLITAILHMKNLLPDKHQLLHINIALVNYHLKKSAIKLQDDILHSRLQQTKHRVSILLKLIEQLSSARYSVPRVPRPRIATISKTYEVLTSTSEEVFMIYARMTRKSFFSLSDAIKNHYIFYNNSTNPQAPAEMQLLVALSHLGLYGNGGSPHVLAQYYNISVGSVENYTNRCIFAIIETLEAKHVYWPNAEQRANFTSTLKGNTVFDGCIGFVDGTIFPLASAPTKHKEDYWMRKMVYAVNSLIVCNWQRRVIYAVHGWCGSAHDQRVYKNSQLYQHPHRFFSPGEYLIADSAYTSTRTVVPAFKRAPGQPLPPDKQKFNFELSHNRVIVEHTIGMLKNRWQSLKLLSLEILSKKTAKRLNTWLRACVVVHNYLLDLREAEWDILNAYVPNFDPSEDEEEDSGVIDGEDLTLREQLFTQFCQLL
ncbi:hypothetical protein PGT21_021202 [Puccinia graminis f. sp. tritici]|uniref:DDE Tnp4 domain-containing protein n=1 Tax=Puccinia graminis f. sp. tritici TaxID=56615 RepID=A0A5B0P6F7_PUCGR|nr:hypothetical protein PGT21_021202 [Puccinia graminis f. sp. tritici]